MTTPESPFALGGARLCGVGRTHGAVYLECGLSPHGKALESYLIDLPSAIDPQQFGIRPLGQTLIQSGGVTHVLDWVGHKHYPYPADFIEEGRRMGFSRKIAPNLELSRLSPASTMIFLHPKAHLDNAADLAPFADAHRCPCRQGHPAHEPCAAYHWRVPPPTPGSPHTRALSQHPYPLEPLRPGHPEPKLSPALFLAVPLTAVTLVRRSDGTVDPALEARAALAGVPVAAVSI